MEDLAFEIGEQHVGTSYDTPLRKDAFDKTDDEKIESISWHFEKIMETLGLDLNDVMVTNEGRFLILMTDGTVGVIPRTGNSFNYSGDYVELNNSTGLHL